MASWYEDAYDRARESEELDRREDRLEDLPPLWVEGFGPFADEEQA